MHSPRRAAVAFIVGAGALLAIAGPAAAHVEPDPSRVKPGKTTTVGFTPEHGCKESPIISMKFRIPKGASEVTPEPKDGWDVKATRRTVTFSGGTMPSDATDAFEISFTAPDKKTVLSWKVVQGCEEGVERWIQGPDGETPAPRVGVGKAAPSDEDHKD
jgi:periplasmic copper chaperone A